VTADHALLIDGILVQAGALANGQTIAAVPQYALGEHYTVYRIETEVHEIILAERGPAETFIDNVPRRIWDRMAAMRRRSRRSEAPRAS